MLEGIAFLVFSLLVVYVCYWSIKAEDSDPAMQNKKKFTLDR